MMENYVRPFSLFTQQDIYLFKEGSHFKLYNLLGSHQIKYEGKDGVYFAVWAPNAKSVSVIGDFNYWDKRQKRLKDELLQRGMRF